MPSSCRLLVPGGTPWTLFAKNRGCVFDRTAPWTTSVKAYSEFIWIRALPGRGQHLPKAFKGKSLRHRSLGQGLTVRTSNRPKSQGKRGWEKRSARKKSCYKTCGYWASAKTGHMPRTVHLSEKSWGYPKHSPLSPSDSVQAQSKGKAEL